MPAETKFPKTTIYFDGACPLCRAEISHYSRTDHAGALSFVDVSESDACVPAGLTRRLMMERFHVRGRNGELLSGAAAFIEVWARLPRWRWAARAAALPGAIAMLELGYRLFLPVRPLISRLSGKIRQLSRDQANRG
jgi:predicted DCC family thiol-disulfide oxidoreductase YuxK